MLRFAVMSDPQGAAIVVFTPNPAMPSPERSAPPTPGTIAGTNSTQPTSKVGLTSTTSYLAGPRSAILDMGSMGVYRIFDEGDHKEMGDGGMMTKDPHIPMSCWNFYFNVDSIKAAIERVESGGGKIINGPMQVPGGGWIIQGQDPQGAMFSLVSNKE
jgi:predicted enzyme related to lactoylglutathione lyase